VILVAVLLYFIAGEHFASAIVGIVGLAVAIVALVQELAGKKDGDEHRSTRVSIDVGTADRTDVTGIDRDETPSDGTDDVAVSVEEARDSKATGIKERGRDRTDRG
jgi:hypothetical protein